MLSDEQLLDADTTGTGELVGLRAVEAAVHADMAVGLPGRDAHDAILAAKAAAWDEGAGEGATAAINFTPLPPNPYRVG